MEKGGMRQRVDDGSILLGGGGGLSPKELRVSEHVKTKGSLINKDALLVTTIWKT